MTVFLRKTHGVRLNLTCFLKTVFCIIRVCLFLDKPGKPGTPQIDDVTEDSVSLSWKPPKSDGGSEITNYIVEHRLDGAFQWKQTRDVIAQTLYTVRKLQKDSVYEFRVYAENKAGVGPASDVTQPTKIETRIGKLLYFLEQVALKNLVYCFCSYYVY